MNSVVVKHTDPNSAEILSNALTGKRYKKVYVCRVHGTDNITLEYTDDKLVILHRRSIKRLPPIAFEIDELVLAKQKMLRGIPEFLLEQSKYIRIKSTIVMNEIPEVLRPKIKKQMYENANKHEMKPNSKYFAANMLALSNINFDNIRCLILSANHDTLSEMVKYLVEQIDTHFKVVHIQHMYTDYRENIELFDMSLLAGIRTDRLFLNTGPFKNFRKLVAMTSIPKIFWLIIPNDNSHLSMIDGITKELSDPPDVNIDENYTLIDFQAMKPYVDIYEDVAELVIRNQLLIEERRFRATKAIEPTI